MSSSTTAQRRKGGGGAPVKASTKIVHHHEDDVIDLAATTSTSSSSGDVLMAGASSSSSADAAANARMNNINPGGGGALLLVDDFMQKEQHTVAAATQRATVRRNFCGTGPFDKHWLNVDCCGLFCAFLTYCLHVFGVYAVCFVLIPPWMSYVIVDDENSTEIGDEAAAAALRRSSTSLPGQRHLTITGQMHRFVFIAMALLACIAHFKAMTTDPGAVPPDAKPLPAENKQDGNVDANGDAEGAPPRKSQQQQQQHLRLCRRCRAYKPPRAHHCSVCKRCIIKMDHHCPWYVFCLL
jgi:ribosomal protein L40E